VEVQEVRLGSKIGGRVADVAVREGDLVGPGQVLARFEAPELMAQKQQLEGRLQQAEAELAKVNSGFRSEEKDAAKSAVAAALARWQRLKAGARKEEIDQAKADLERAVADVKVSRQKLDRIRRVISPRAVSFDDYDSAVASLKRAEAQVAGLRAKLDLLLAGSRKEEIEEAAAELKRVRANYDLLLAGNRSEDVSAAQARVLEAKGKLIEIEANLREAVVRAPEQAVVEVLAVRKGDLVQPGQTIIRVLRADDLWVKVYVPETQLGKLALGQQVKVLIDSYPDKPFSGQVTQIAGESEFTPRNVQSADE
jgi:multidrug resistance efflux pump